MDGRKYSTFSGTEGIYLLPHDKIEVDRVKHQHMLMRSNTAGDLIKTPLPPPGGDVSVLDVGCSDGTWLLDLANSFPDRNWSLHGVDITTKFFRARGNNNANTLDLREHDANEPFPTFWSWHNSFDIVHQRLMIFGVKSKDWPNEVGNLTALVKPGGWIQLAEMEWIDPNPATPLLEKQAVLQKWTCSQFGMDLDVAIKLEDLLKDAGFTNVQKFQYDHGIGPKAREEKWKSPSADMWNHTFRGFAEKVPEEGIPGVAKTGPELHEFLDSLNKDVKKHGYLAKLNYVVAQKPE